MEENFNPVAQTRANYYTPGSPVQFVCVELLKGDVSGEHAVCLTFKNISRVTLTALEIHFKCKGVDGVILCEDKFEYRDLQVKPGELFGQDEGTANVGVLPRLVHSRFGLHVVEVLQRDPGQMQPFEVVQDAVAQSLRQQVWVTALRQAMQLLAGRWEVRGVDLDVADSPLLQ